MPITSSQDCKSWLKEKLCYFGIENFLNSTLSKIEPWGLRVQIFPNINKVETNVRMAWEANLQTCFFNMMHILCEKYGRNIANVDIEIKDWQEITQNVHTYTGILL